MAKGIYKGVNPAKLIAMGMIAVWVLITHHCVLERFPSFGFLACSPEPESGQHLPSDCASEGDVCATVEDGGYRSEEYPVFATPAPAVVPVLTLILLNVREPVSSQAAPEPSPPELGRVWQFTYRTALPPRAPSVAS